MVDRHQNQRLAYDFLIDHALSGHTFTAQDFEDATGWKPSTVDTYLSKYLRDFIEKPHHRQRRSERELRIRHEFARVSVGDFLNLATQSREVYSKYQRVKYASLISFEFLLLLTRGDELRSALDAMFYKDTVTQRLVEIGLGKVEQIVERPPGISDDQYTELVCRTVSEKFGGYSISHVNGRFRMRELLARGEAGGRLAKGDRYLIDEYTAVVRFLIPCQTTRLEYDADFDSISNAISGHRENAANSGVRNEADMIRLLFFHLFVEAVVRTINGEAEIWLVESGLTSRLYVWEKLGI